MQLEFFVPLRDGHETRNVLCVLERNRPETVRASATCCSGGIGDLREFPKVNTMNVRSVSRNKNRYWGAMAVKVGWPASSQNVHACTMEP